MDDKKALKLCKAIDKALTELAEFTGVNHISAFIVNGWVFIEDLSDIENKKVDYFREAGRE